MRKFASAALMTTAVVGSLGLAASEAAAAVAPQGRMSVATVTEERAQDVALQATCVKPKKWFNSGSGRYVRVQNTCGGKVCFSVTVAARRDPQFSIKANKTEDFRYGGILWTKGTGLKRIGC